MPRQARPAPASTRAGNLQYIDPVLSQSQKDELREWAAGQSDTELLQLLAETISERYGVSIRNNDTGAQCTLSPAGDDHKHSGKLLIARASSPIAALRVALYKHVYVLAGEWPDSPRSSFDL